VFDVMVRNAMWRRVELFARDDVAALAALDAGGESRGGEKQWGAADWDQALEDYYQEHPRLLVDADARGPGLLSVEKRADVWEATQTLHDPEGDHDWVIVAEVDLAASDEAGEAVVRTLRVTCLTD
jgi:hypothetical protein